MKWSDLCDGCKYFLEHCVGLCSASDTWLDVKPLGAGAGNESVAQVNIGQHTTHNTGGTQILVGVCL